VCPLSRRAYSEQSAATSWEEIWEAGPYYDRISDCLESAQNFAIFVGWQIDSRLPMKGKLLHETLKEKLIRLCESRPLLHVYLLMWDHAYFYIFERETWQARIWENIHPRIHFVFDNRHPFGGSHHEKICIIDGHIAYCGGIDLCDDRWDTPQHLYQDPRRSLDWKNEQHGPYHDLAVQVTGPICAELQNHVAERWRALCHIEFPDPPPPRCSIEKANLFGHKVYLSRTLIPIAPAPESPTPIREVEFLFRDLILSAQKRIILEGQYYWSTEINDLLIYKTLKMKNQDFEIILILTDLEKTDTPTRKMAPHQWKLLRKLKKTAHHSRVRLIYGSPYIFPPEDLRFSTFPRPIYIHSKVIIIDDRYLSVGSANFATRAFRLDTELNLTFEARTVAERLHISRTVQFILTHWNQNSVRLIQTDRDISRSWTKTWLRWEFFFDPNAPWIFLKKKKFFGFLLNEPRWAIVSIFPFWTISAMIVIFTTHLSLGTQTPEAGFFCWVLSAIWAVRLPYVFTLVILAWINDAASTVPILLTSLWIGAGWSYALARLLPSTAARLYKTQEHPTLDQIIGNRTFSALLRILIDPRIDIHLKISYPGLYFIPLPWFILGVGLILPALIYPWISLGEILSSELGDLAKNLELLKPFVRSFLPFALLCWIARELFYGPAKNQSQRTFLQHSQRIQPKQPSLESQRDSTGHTSSPS